MLPIEDTAAVAYRPQSGSAVVGQSKLAGGQVAASVEPATVTLLYHIALLAIWFCQSPLAFADRQQAPERRQ